MQSRVVKLCKLYLPLSLRPAPGKLIFAGCFNELNCLHHHDDLDMRAAGNQVP